MGAMQLDSKLLATFTTTFFGYGNLAADWWFVGMEEGGGHSDDEISARLAAWRELGATPTVDIVDFGRRAGIDEHLQWFEGDRPPLQSTWRQLIRMILGAQGRDTSADAVGRQMALCDFGEASETVVLERGGRALKACLVEQGGVERGGTVFANVLHPTAWGVPSAYFVECGRLCS